MSQTLGDLLRDTDALTFANALKVTLTEIKDELSTQEELTDYLLQSRERTKKLIRKADNQYRVIAKLCTHQAALTTDVTVEEEEDLDTYEELMTSVE